MDLAGCRSARTARRHRASRSIQAPTWWPSWSGLILFAIIARRSRDLSTATLILMAVAIAINIAVGAIGSGLRLPLYLDSIGTVLVGALAGPWAGALTGLLSNLIWSLLPVPGGAGPTAAFFAPVAGDIGLMAGFWASRGVFQLRPDDVRIGGFLALAFGIVGAAIALLAAQRRSASRTSGPPTRTSCSRTSAQFLAIAVGCIAVGVVVGWLTGRTVFAFRGPGSTDPRPISSGRPRSRPPPSCSPDPSCCSRRTATSRT